MCTVPPTTEKSLRDHSEVVGLQCPLCAGDDGAAGASKLGYMQFLDPHGVMRVDPQLFECGARRHSFTATPGGGLRLLAADGARPKARRVFHVDAGQRLAEAEPAAARA